MNTINEIKKVPKKFSKYSNKIIDLLKQHNINSIQKLVKHYKENEDFKNNWKNIWLEITKKEGGKVSLTTTGIIIGSALGGVEITAMGSAIGLPLALVLGLGGFIGGSTFDSFSFFGSKKPVTIKLSKKVIKKIKSDASEYNISIDELIERIVEQAYSEGI